MALKARIGVDVEAQWKKTRRGSRVKSRCREKISNLQSIGRKRRAFISEQAGLD